MTDLRFHNTLTGEKQTFQPIKPGEVSLYVCGITPYDETHLGHGRCYVVFDVLRRTLERQGFKVRHIQNFTDVDDKIIERASKLGKDPLTYPAPFIEAFKRHMERLNVRPASEYPLVTTHMAEIVAMIEVLVANGLGYVLDGSVYFQVREFDRRPLPRKYGDLSKRDVDDLEAGARVEVDERKKDPLDFALWKKAKPGEPSWPSPWGPGRPGWHIECSAMSRKYLGDEFDIHGGGLDLVFPHHTNEIAQSVGATGKSFARVWMHNGFVTINQQKMSKSLGNFFTLTDIFKRFDPMVVRYFLLSQHYRSPLNFSDQELQVAEKTWRDRICGAYRIAEKRANEFRVVDGGTVSHGGPLDQALCDDLNTPKALAYLNTICSYIFSGDEKLSGGSQADAKEWVVWWAVLNDILDTLGLIVPAEEHWPPEILALVEQREDARKTKQWSESDRARDELKRRGVLVEDTPAGPRLKKIS